MKLHKLNIRGFSHELVLVALIVAVGIGGSAYLLVSHADTCPVVSGVASSPTSCATTAPVSTVVTAGSCTVALTSAVPLYGQTVSAKVTVANTGQTVFTPNVATSFATYDAAGTATVRNATQLTLSALSVGGSLTSPLAYTYKVPYQTSQVMSGKYLVKSVNPAFSCSASFKLPVVK